jgi:hypothetical protein
VLKLLDEKADVFCFVAYVVNTQQERMQPTNSNAHAHRGNLYINISNKRRQQFPRLVILKSDDDHNGRNM